MSQPSSEVFDAAERLIKLIQNFNKPERLNDEQRDVILVCTTILNMKKE